MRPEGLQLRNLPLRREKVNQWGAEDRIMFP